MVLSCSGQALLAQTSQGSTLSPLLDEVPVAPAPRGETPSDQGEPSAESTEAPAPTTTTTPVAPPPWPTVTPKRIGAPSTTVGKRITVQIKPSTPTAAAPLAPAVPQAQQAADMMEWYWNAVPHDIWEAGPARFAPALAALSHAQAAQLSRPGFQDVTNIAAAHGVDILVNSIGTQVSPALALAVISVESSGKNDALSSAGAQGLMQLIPETATRFGVTDPNDPAQNIKGGIAYLDWLLTEFSGDVVLALAGYNAGENAVKKHNGVPPFAETRAYVPKVMAAWEVARRLCVTPPDLYSDGCVFATNALRSSN